MQLPDIWQLIGSSQVAEFTTLVSIAVSIYLAQKSSPTQKSLSQQIASLKKSLFCSGVSIISSHSIGRLPSGGAVGLPNGCAWSPW